MTKLVPALAFAALLPLSAVSPRQNLPVGMTFIQVPASDAHPTYWIQQTETTRAVWRAVMNTEPWKTHDTFFRSGDTIPAAFITWHEVQDFIQKLNAADLDFVYRLPTEAEWEEAARAGASQEPLDLDAVAWFNENAFLTTTDKFTHAVALKAPNAWGLYDCFGNAWEWVQDAAEGNDRVIKGGSWRANRAANSSTGRNWLDAHQFAGDLGFRLAAIPVESGLWGKWTPAQHGNYPLSWRTRWVSSDSKGRATWALHLRNEGKQTVDIHLKWGLGSTSRSETMTLEAGVIREIYAPFVRTEKGQRPVVTLMDCRPK